jgi:hypothetical protein
MEKKAFADLLRVLNTNTIKYYLDNLLGLRPLGQVTI